MSVQFLKSVDGNQAAAHVAYALSDISFLFPITPATSMGELSDLWAETGRKNIWGQKVDVVPMQSEGGVSGAIHGATVSGAIVSTFTCSQGLLLMIPNMFKIAGEVQPLVIHVASRAAGGQSLTIFADNNDVMSTRASGFAYLNSQTVQEVADMALVAHLSTLQGGVPFMHFFDGFRTSHEISKIQLPEYDAIAKLVDRDAVQRLRDRALNPLHPHLVGTVEGSDVFFQNEEHHNHFYNELPEIVEANMRKVEAMFGRSYHIFEYYGHPEPESIIVMMGAGVPTTEEALDTLVNKEGKKWGLVKVLFSVHGVLSTSSRLFPNLSSVLLLSSVLRSLVLPLSLFSLMLLCLSTMLNLILTSLVVVMVSVVRSTLLDVSVLFSRILNLRSLLITSLSTFLMIALILTFLCALNSTPSLKALLSVCSGVLVLMVLLVPIMMLSRLLVITLINMFRVTSSMMLTRVVV